MPTFTEMYETRQKAGKYICVGLDPDPKQLPEGLPGNTLAERVSNFLVGIVDATHEYALAYKPQYAYYSMLGEDGPRVLRDIIAYIRAVDPSIPVILDYKRGDIGRTNEAYVYEAFDFYGADAATVHPYLGMEAMMPFLDQTDKTIIVLCRTSNPGAGEFQDADCIVYCHEETGHFYSTLDEYTREHPEAEPYPPYFERVVMKMYQFVAYRVAQKWNKAGNCAVVVGATYAERELKEVRGIVGDMTILIPGIGTQGGDLAESILHGQNSGGWGIVLNNSSALLFAYKKLKQDDSDELKYNPEQYAEASAEATQAMHNAIADVLTHAA